MCSLDKLSGAGGDGSGWDLFFHGGEQAATLGNAPPAPTAKTSTLPVAIRDNIVTAFKWEEPLHQSEQDFRGYDLE